VKPRQDNVTEDATGQRLPAPETRLGSPFLNGDNRNDPATMMLDRAVHRRLLRDRILKEMKPKGRLN